MNAWHWQWAVFCHPLGGWAALPGSIGPTWFSTRLGILSVRSAPINRVFRLLARGATRPKGFLFPGARRRQSPQKRRSRRSM